MTLALIVLVVFLIVWINQSAKIKGDKHTHRKRTITNVQLQDELSAKNFKKVIADLTALPSSNTLSGDSLIDAIEGLYEQYDLPDRRTADQKKIDRAKYLAAIASAREDEEYPIDDSGLPLTDRIWHYPFDAPLLDRPDLFVGTPNTIVEVNGVKYKYDDRGIPANLYQAIPAKLVGDLEVLLTMRELDAAGYKYSWNRQPANWQRAEIAAEQYKETKKKYPWLYR